MSLIYKTLSIFQSKNADFQALTPENQGVALWSFPPSAFHFSIPIRFHIPKWGRWRRIFQKKLKEVGEEFGDEREILLPLPFSPSNTCVIWDSAWTTICLNAIRGISVMLWYGPTIATWWKVLNGHLSSWFSFFAIWFWVRKIYSKIGICWSIPQKDGRCQRIPPQVQNKYRTSSG